MLINKGALRLWQKYLKENEAIVARQQEERRRAAKRNELLGDQIYVLTPRGDVIQ